MQNYSFSSVPLRISFRSCAGRPLCLDGFADRQVTGRVCGCVSTPPPLFYTSSSDQRPVAALGEPPNKTKVSIVVVVVVVVAAATY